MATMKNKRVTFLLVLVCLIAVSPMAKAQCGGNLPNIFNINGLVMCTLNGTLNGTSAPPFANAAVKLQCGSNNLTIANSTTDAKGLFSFATSRLSLPQIANCRVVLQSPLSSCNPSLPSTAGGLTASLAVTGGLASRVAGAGIFYSGPFDTTVVSATGFVPI